MKDKVFVHVDAKDGRAARGLERRLKNGISAFIKSDEYPKRRKGESKMDFERRAQRAFIKKAVSIAQEKRVRKK